MICYEFFENSKLYKILEKTSEKPLSKLGFSHHSSITMLVGIVLGIAYGAGILIKNATSGKMTYKEILLSSLFLATCHAVFEDTLLFVAVGGNGFVILGIRIFLGISIIAMLSGFFKRNNF
jgi:hypothetical protein